MPLWKKTDTATVSGKPNWLTRAASGVGRLEDCYATNRGWVLRHTTSGGTREELLVPIRNLAGTQTATDTLAAASISAVYFTAAVSGGSGGSVTVVYNEKVNVTSGALLAIDSSSTDFNATAAAQTGVNKVVFTIAASDVAQNHTLTIADQTLGGGNKIKDALDTSRNSEKVIDISEHGVGVGGSGAFATITVGA